MLRRIILTALPLVSGSRLNDHGLGSRQNEEECCACSGAAEGVQSVATATVTIEHTVTEQAATVFITQACKPAQITVTCDAVGEPSVPQHTVVVVQPPKGPVDNTQDDFGNGDELCDDDVEDSDEVLTKTVTIHAKAPGPKTITVSEVAPRPSPPAPEVVTVTAPAEEVPNPDQLVQTVTVQPMPEKVVDDHQYATVTAPPNGHEAIDNSDNFKTVTNTVPGDDGSDCVEITVIDVISGQQTCHVQDSDSPCKGAPSGAGQDAPEPALGEIICDPVNTTTSITTFYNTIIQTVDGPPANTVVVPPTPTEAPSSTRTNMARRSWWWMSDKA